MACGGSMVIYLPRISAWLRSGKRELVAHLNASLLAVGDRLEHFKAVLSGCQRQGELLRINGLAHDLEVGEAEGELGAEGHLGLCVLEVEAGALGRVEQFVEGARLAKESDLVVVHILRQLLHLVI